MATDMFGNILSPEEEERLRLHQLRMGIEPTPMVTPSLYPNQAAPYGSFPYADPTPPIWDSSQKRLRQDVPPDPKYQGWDFNQEPIADTSAISNVPQMAMTRHERSKLQLPIGPFTPLPDLGVPAFTPLGPSQQVPARIRQTIPTANDPTGGLSATDPSTGFQTVSGIQNVATDQELFDKAIRKDLTRSTGQPWASPGGDWEGTGTPVPSIFSFTPEQLNAIDTYPGTLNQVTPEVLPSNIDRTPLTSQKTFFGGVEWEDAPLQDLIDRGGFEGLGPNEPISIYDQGGTGIIPASARIPSGDSLAVSPQTDQDYLDLGVTPPGSEIAHPAQSPLLDQRYLEQPDKQTVTQDITQAATGTTGLGHTGGKTTAPFGTDFFSGTVFPAVTGEDYDLYNDAQQTVEDWVGLSRETDTPFTGTLSDWDAGVMKGHQLATVGAVPPGSDVTLGGGIANIGFSSLQPIDQIVDEWGTAPFVTTAPMVGAFPAESFTRGVLGGVANLQGQFFGPPDTPVTAAYELMNQGVRPASHFARDEQGVMSPALREMVTQVDEFSPLANPDISAQATQSMAAERSAAQLAQAAQSAGVDVSSIDPAVAAPGGYVNLDALAGQVTAAQEKQAVAAEQARQEEADAKAAEYMAAAADTQDIMMAGGTLGGGTAPLPAVSAPMAPRQQAMPAAVTPAPTAPTVASVAAQNILAQTGPSRAELELQHRNRVAAQEAQAAIERVAQAQALMSKYGNRDEPAENYMSAAERDIVAAAQVDTFAELGTTGGYEGGSSFAGNVGNYGGMGGFEGYR